jgi:hypothetical protein
VSELKGLLVATVLLLLALGLALGFLRLILAPIGAAKVPGKVLRLGGKMLGSLLREVGKTVCRLLSVALNWPPRRIRRPQIGARRPRVGR